MKKELKIIGKDILAFITLIFGLVICLILATLLSIPLQKGLIWIFDFDRLTVPLGLICLAIFIGICIFLIREYLMGVKKRVK